MGYFPPYRTQYNLTQPMTRDTKGTWKYLCGLLLFAASVFAILTGGRKNQEEQDTTANDPAGHFAAEDRLEIKGSPPPVETRVKQGEKRADVASLKDIKHISSCGCASCTVGVNKAADQASVRSQGVSMDAKFLSQVMKPGDGSAVSFELPGGKKAEGKVEYSRAENGKVVMAQGKLTAPEAGFFFFQKQSMDGKAGSMVGVVRFDNSDLAYSVVAGAGDEPVLVEQSADSVICRNYAAAAPAENAVVLEGPEDYPEDTNIPAYQNGVPRYESMPGATAVLYLDFDGQSGQIEGWNVVDALPSGLSAAQIRATWEHVAEDFAPFNMNVTTDKAVYDSAPENSRQRCLISPSSPVESGVAYIGSFNWTGDTPCWAGYRGSKVGHEVLSHELGHTLGLSHDGRTDPSEAYFAGYGAGETGWAPIMGNSYYKEVTQWSKGEYTNANQLQDDLAIITNNNNNVDYKTDDHSDSTGAASALGVDGSGSVASQGIVETSADVDTFVFATTAAGPLTLVANPGVHDANLDILLELLDSSGAVVATANPAADLDATVTVANLPAGTYYVQVSGVGKGDPAWGGYSDYASLGHYKLSGSVSNASDAVFFVAENQSAGTTVGTVVASGLDPQVTPAFTITAGNGGGEFAINSSTGVITSATVLDFESASYYELTVEATDGVLTDTSTVVINVSDVNEAPTLGGTSGSVAEDVSVGTPVATVSGSDPDAGDSLSYAITGGNTGGAFAINSSTGEITTATALDYETTNSYSLIVTATDGGGLNDSAAVAITVTNVSELVSYGSDAEFTSDGSVVSGSYADTVVSNNVYEVLQENKTNGKPSSRVSSLDHTWSFDIGAGGVLAELSVEAYHSVNSEGDDFVFSYSTDGINFTDLITVTKTSDDNTAQTAALPSGVSGTVYIRVQDTDRTTGNGEQDTISIDRLTLEVVE